MSFRLKILASFLGLLTAVLGASLWNVNRVETRRVEAEILAAHETASQVFEEILAGRERQLKSSLSLLSGDFAFKQAVATGDPGTILSAASNHRARIGSDLLMVTDAEGKLLADTRRQLRAGRSVKGLEVVGVALEGKPGARIQVLGGVPYQLSAVPITAPDVIGALVAGFQIDDRLARSLKTLTRTEIAFAAGGEVFASTLAELQGAGVSARLKGLEPGRPELVAVSGERFLTMSVRRTPEVTVFLMRSWDQALEPARALQRDLLGIGFFGLAVTAVLGFLIAEGVTTSLRKLVAATVKIAKGEYDVSVQIRSQDEIGRLGESFNAMAKGLVEREKIRSVLRKAVSKEIAESLLAQGQIELGGEERTVTILFADIRSFTTISEALKPKELVSQLNAYFTAMARAIDAHHGVIDKYVGDAIMALFGAPLGTREDAANAVRAALAMARALEEINAERRNAGLQPWRNGIGLNTGTAVAGTLGSEDRWSYTVIGDSVNLASRLEGLTKHYGARVIVSDSTRQEAPGFVYRTLDRVIVKGRTDAVQIYEALGEGEAPAWLAGFEKGLEAYRQRRWEEAKAAFEAVLRSVPGDGPAAMYLDRVGTMRLNPPSAGPDEPTKMTEK